jgi:hypothetical protein
MGAQMRKKNNNPAKMPGVKLSKNEDQYVPEMLYKHLPRGMVGRFASLHSTTIYIYSLIDKIHGCY